MSVRNSVFNDLSLLPDQQSQLIGQRQIGALQLLVGRIHCPAPGYHHDIPAWLELALMKAVDLPQSAADPVADHRMAQLGADRQANPVFLRAVFSGIDDQKRVGRGRTPTVESAKEMIFF